MRNKDLTDFLVLVFNRFYLGCFLKECKEID